MKKIVIVDAQFDTIIEIPDGAIAKGSIESKVREYPEETGIEKVIITSEAIHNRVALLAQCAVEFYDEQEVEVIELVPIYDAAFIFTADLMRNMSVYEGPLLHLNPIGLCSYGTGTESEEIRVTYPLRPIKEGSHVLIVDTMVDTRKSMGVAYDHVMNYTLASLKSIALLDKPGKRRAIEIKNRPELANIETVGQFSGLSVPENNFNLQQLTGFRVPEVWCAGYGLDMQNRYMREIPEIVVGNPEIFDQRLKKY